MDRIQEALDGLIGQHDEHMVDAYAQLKSGCEPSEIAVQWAYGAGLQHAIRTIQDALNRR